MSLTSLLRQPEVASQFRTIVCRPQTQPVGEMRVTPRHSSYPLVGTAFDYALRWLVGSWNRTPQTEWVAERAAHLWEEAHGQRNELVDRGIARARAREQELRTTGVFTSEMGRACLFLATVDRFLRDGVLPTSQLTAPLASEVADVVALVRLVPREPFISDAVLLNPTFGKYSEQVGGADADLVVGDCLIDVKTTKYLRVPDEYLFQLVGYAALQRYARPKWPLKYIAVYFSRHGMLERFALDTLLERGTIEGLKQAATCLLNARHA